MSERLIDALCRRIWRELYRVPARLPALRVLHHMLLGDELTPLGSLVLDEMNRAFCADVRQMLDEGKDPMAELARERRATQ
ncbi:hypothetical protein ACET6M_09830 [Aeromonas veronii]